MKYFIAVLFVSVATATAVQAQDRSDGPPTVPYVFSNLLGSKPSGLTFAGFTLYGTIDINAFYQSHGSAASPYMNGQYLVAKNSGPTQFGITNNALSQSIVGLRTLQPIGDLVDAPGLKGWSITSNISTAFDPTFGKIQNTCKSLVLANGTNNVVGTQSNFDSARCGQAINGELWGGLKNDTLGEVRFGRQLTVLFDDMYLLYDPQRISYATSLLGTAGTYGGGFGDTEDKIWNNSLQYRNTLGPLRFAGHYRFPGDQQGGRAFALDLGADFTGPMSGLSVDGVYGQFKDGISASPLTSSATRAAGSCQSLAITLANCTSVNILNAVVSDNAAFALMAAYNLKSVALPTLTVMGGYENIRYKNPAQTLPAGYQTIGGYTLNYTSATFNTYTTAKVFDLPWIGARWDVTPALAVAVGYYHLSQNSYVRAGASCTNPGSGTATQPQCPGTISWWSATMSYKFASRADFYVGLSRSAVNGGFSSGYTFTSNYNVVSGVRFRL